MVPVEVAQLSSGTTYCSLAQWPYQTVVYVPTSKD